MLLMRALRALAFASPAALLPLLGWASCSQSSAVALVDGGASDVRAESARPKRDAEPEEVDGGESDAPVVIDRSWLTGDWDPIASLPRCDILIARHPERDVPPFKWKRCGSGRAGCSELDVDWTTNPGRKLFAWDKEPVHPARDGKPVLLIRKRYPTLGKPSSTDHDMTVLQDLNGSTLWAEAYSFTPRSESLTTSGVSSPQGFLQVITSRTQPTARYRASTWNALLAPTEVDVSFQTLGGSQSIVHINEASALVLTLDTNRWVLVNYTTGAVINARLALDDPREFPGGFLVRSYAAGTPVIYLKNNGAFENYLPAAPSRTVTGYAVDRTQGNAIVWVEATGLAPSTNPVMYTAPYAATAAGVVPLRVTAYDDPSGFGGGYMIAANGFALNRTSPTRVLLTRLSNGDSWTIDAEPGDGIWNPLWVDAQHVWLGTGKLDINGVNMESESILRIDRASLGAPIPAR
jgi:hypothetical protein